MGPSLPELTLLTPFEFLGSKKFCQGVCQDMCRGSQSLHSMQESQLSRPRGREAAGCVLPAHRYAACSGLPQLDRAQQRPRTPTSGPTRIPPSQHTLCIVWVKCPLVSFGESQRDWLCSLSSFTGQSRGWDQGCDGMKEGKERKHIKYLPNGNVEGSNEIFLECLP